MSTSIRVKSALLMVAMTVILVGCGATVPTDPGGTLQQVSGGEMRVGVSPDQGLADVSAGVPTGPLVDLVDAFAESVDADVTWTIDGEETLVTMIEEGKLDLAVGGFTDQTPWVDNVGVTRGYPGIGGADGRTIVMFVPPGENAFLAHLEAYLDTAVTP